MRPRSRSDCRSAWLHAGLVLPLLVCATFVRSAGREAVCGDPASASAACSTAFARGQLLLVIATSLVRATQLRCHAQAFLQLARRSKRVESAPVPARHFACLCIVAIQLLAPFVLLLCCQLARHSIGGHAGHLLAFAGFWTCAAWTAALVVGFAHHRVLAVAGGAV